MFDYTAYLAAQEGTRELAHSALPNAPTVRSDTARPTRGQPRHRNAYAIRRRAAVALYQLAERVQPA